MLFALTLSFVTLAAPDPLGVFKSPERIVQVTLVGEGRFQVRQWGLLDVGYPAQFDPARPRALRLEYGDVLEFSEDFSTFTALSRSDLFGEVRTTQTFTRLPKAELEQLVKATSTGEQEAVELLTSLHLAEVDYWLKSGKFSADAKTIGFGPEACLDGSRAKARKGQLAGCRFVVAIELQGTEYVGAVFGAAPEVKGRVMTISSKARGTNAAGSIRIEHLHGD